MPVLMMKFIMGMVWLILGGVILVTEQINGPMHWRLPGDFSVGWIAVALGLFNLFRAATIWQAREEYRRKKEEEEAAYRQSRRHQSERPEQPPDPNFQFDTPPQAPSANEPESPKT